MKEMLSYIFLMGEKVRLRNQLASFLKFLLCPTVCSYRYQACCIRIGTFLTPIGCCVLFVENSIDFFMARLLHICFCWMVSFVYDDGIS